jgi:hypothetical protein
MKIAIEQIRLRMLKLCRKKEVAGKRRHLKLPFYQSRRERDKIYPAIRIIPFLNTQ